MTLPKPEPGLVIRYSYLWHDEFLEGRRGRGEGQALPQPKRIKLDWRFNHLDLGVYERVSDTFIVMKRGWA